MNASLRSFRSISRVVVFVDMINVETMKGVKRARPYHYCYVYLEFQIIQRFTMDVNTCRRTSSLSSVLAGIYPTFFCNKRR
jgi:hypothetical protein